MKIAITSVTDTGIKRVRSELISELQKEHTVIVLAPNGRCKNDIINLGCEYVDIEIEQHGKNIISDLKLYKKYIKELKKISPDIVLTFTTKPNVYCGIACRKLNIPLIVNITGMGSALAQKGLLQKYLMFLYKIALGGNNVKTVFFQNDYSKLFFEKNKIGNKKNFIRIPGSGVNLLKYSTLPYPDDTQIHFLFIGRILKLKGIEDYLFVAKAIRDKNKNVFFHVLTG